MNYKNVFNRFRRNSIAVESEFSSSLTILLEKSFAQEYTQRFQTIIEIEEEGEKDLAKIYRSQYELSFIAIQRFLLENLNSEVFSNFTVGKIFVDSSQIEKFMNSALLSDDMRIRQFADELAESCIYYFDAVQKGNFLMMPGADLKKSNSYRSYLLGNSLNGNFNWGWEDSDQNDLKRTDSLFTQIMANVVTANYDLLKTTVKDKLLIFNLHKKACFFVSYLCSVWEFSTHRSRIGLNE